MYLRLWFGILLWLVALGLSGCYQASEGQSEEQKNEYFIVGKERAAARDYKGAIEAFEKAVQTNPRSALAHFELAVLYEQHGEQKENDYVSAMYHYFQALKLRPNDYPAENARQRISACKQELVKAESLAPVAQGMIRELDRLKEENQALRKQLEAAKAQLAARPPVQPPPDRPGFSGPTGGGISDRTGTRSGSPLSPGGRITPLPPAVRTHTVKERETLSSIARQYGLKLSTLMAANPTVEPKRLKPGQTLNIPSS